MSGSAVSAIRGSDLDKRFGEVAAVSRVSLEVAAGGALGIVGANGAGKTTLLRMICGLLAPDSGQVEIAGADPLVQPARARRRLGCQLGDGPLFELLTGAEQLHWTGEVIGVPAAQRGERIGELASQLDLRSALDRRVATYSAGMRRKLAFANALVGDPRQIVLDEPFEGVDPLGIRRMKQILDQFRAAGAGILLTSHQLGAVEDVCTSLLVLREGRVVFAGDRESLKAKLPPGGSGFASQLEALILGEHAGESRTSVLLRSLARPVE